MTYRIFLNYKKSRTYDFLALVERILATRDYKLVAQGLEI